MNTFKVSSKVAWNHTLLSLYAGPSGIMTSQFTKWMTFRCKLPALSVRAMLSVPWRCIDKKSGGPEEPSASWGDLVAGPNKGTLSPAEQSPFAGTRVLGSCSAQHTLTFATRTNLSLEGSLAKAMQRSKGTIVSGYASFPIHVHGFLGCSDNPHFKLKIAPSGDLLFCRRAGAVANHTYVVLCLPSRCSEPGFRNGRKPNSLGTSPRAHTSFEPQTKQPSPRSTWAER